MVAKEIKDSAADSSTRFVFFIFDFDYDGEQKNSVTEILYAIRGCRRPYAAKDTVTPWLAHHSHLVAAYFKVSTFRNSN
ncbi:hypothetical protein CJD36_022485 [Flavipsychrobacter stenotrophus]|uniref:Uncharacterized protein n=1 Tax=Flavipsychrobacter stenotrophus TaxID=2077091 RepID=A0A2S7SPF4_9BACT|nr:hypothetical protein CJD36_022485 [Flavipsychrobacter stenotrophus]